MALGAWLRRASIAAPLVVLALWLAAPATSAHSYFLDSDPPDGAILAKAPARVVLVFSSAVTADFTSVDLVEARGQHYQPTAVVTDRTTPNVVTVALPQLPTGSYRLTFVTRDRVDLHQTAGSIALALFVAMLWRAAARGALAGLGAEFRRLAAWALLTSQVRALVLAVALTAATSVSGHAAGAAGLTAGEVLLRTAHLLGMGAWA